MESDVPEDRGNSSFYPALEGAVVAIATFRLAPHVFSGNLKHKSFEVQSRSEPGTGHTNGFMKFSSPNRSSVSDNGQDHLAGQGFENKIWFLNLHLIPDASSWEAKVSEIEKWVLFEKARLSRASPVLTESNSEPLFGITRENFTVLGDDVQNFYTSLVIGLDHLGHYFGSEFVTYVSLTMAVDLLQSTDSDMSSMIDNLFRFNDLNSTFFLEVMMDYSYLTGAILALNETLQFCASMLTAYNDSFVESVLVALESFISLTDSDPRTMHTAKAREASQCIDACDREMLRMQRTVTEILLSDRWGYVLQFVPGLDVKDAERFYSRCAGLAGVIFAQKTVAAYISRVLLAGLGYADEGPVLGNHMGLLTSYRAAWSVSLINFHKQVHKAFIKTQQSNDGPRTFMAKEMRHLQDMLGNLQEDLQKFLDQAKFLSTGYQVGWRATKKILVHNVCLFRQQLLASQDGLLKTMNRMESLAKAMAENELRWKERLSSSG